MAAVVSSAKVCDKIPLYVVAGAKVVNSRVRVVGVEKLVYCKARLSVEPERCGGAKFLAPTRRKRLSGIMAVLL